jgi:hypothetical protein
VEKQSSGSIYTEFAGQIFKTLINDIGNLLSEMWQILQGAKKNCDWGHAAASKSGCHHQHKAWREPTFCRWALNICHRSSSLLARYADIHNAAPAAAATRANRSKYCGITQVDRSNHGQKMFQRGTNTINPPKYPSQILSEISVSSAVTPLHRSNVSARQICCTGCLMPPVRAIAHVSTRHFAEPVLAVLVPSLEGTYTEKQQ